MEILELGVQQVINIEDFSPPSTSSNRLEAIYLLTPTLNNINLILSDFNPAITATSKTSKKNSILGSGSISKSKSSAGGGAQPKYSAAHLHFIDTLPDDLAHRLAQLPTQYLLSCTDLYVNFNPIEPRVFSLKSPNAFHSLYAPPGRNPKESIQRWEDEIHFMAKSMVNALATLGEYPLIRYYNPPTSTHRLLGPASTTGEHLCKRLAEVVQHALDDFARNNKDFPPKLKVPRPRGVLYITDRSMDLFAPLLHEFTYQAMCHDLLEITEGGEYKYSFETENNDVEEKTAVLNDNDTVWKEVRHMHMREALEKLINDFKNYVGEHGGTFGNGGTTSLNDMRDMMASLPQLKEVKDKLSLHLTMAQKCMDMFESKKLPQSASVEQCCATGVTPDNRAPKTLVEEMVPLLDDRKVSNTDKLRIIAAYIMHRDGVPSGDLKRLYEHARLALYEMDAVNNLQFLGVDVSKESGKSRKPLFKHKPREEAYDISRFQPYVKSLLEEHYSNSLDVSLFPYVRDAPAPTSTPSVLSRLASSTSNQSSSSPSTMTGTAPGSLRSARATWAADASSSPTSASSSTMGNSLRGANVRTNSMMRDDGVPKQRVIVFVAGGMTYSEIRSIYEIAESKKIPGGIKDVFIGSTNIFTPSTFVTALSSLDRGATSSSMTRLHGLNPSGYEIATTSRLATLEAEASKKKDADKAQWKIDKEESRGNSAGAIATRSRLLRGQEQGKKVEAMRGSSSSSSSPFSGSGSSGVMGGGNGPGSSGYERRYSNDRSNERGYNQQQQYGNDSRNDSRSNNNGGYSNNDRQYSNDYRGGGGNGYDDRRNDRNDYNHNSSSSYRNDDNYNPSYSNQQQSQQSQQQYSNNNGNNGNNNNNGNYSNSLSVPLASNTAGEKKEKEKKKGFLSRFT